MRAVQQPGRWTIRLTPPGPVRRGLLALLRAGGFELPRREGILRGGVLVSQRSRQQTDDRVRQNHCRKFATAEHVVAHAELKWRQLVDGPFIDAFIMPRDQEQSRVCGEFLDAFLFKAFTLRRQQDPGRLAFIQRFRRDNRVVQRLAHQDHSRPAAEGSIIDLAVTVVGVLADVVEGELHHAALLGSTEDARTQDRRKHLRKQGEDVDPQRHE